MAAEPTEPIVREIDIAAAPETVFEFFIDAEKLTRWLATEATVQPHSGGACVQVHEGADRGHGPFHMHGTFLVVDPPTRVVFTWGFTNQEVHVPPGSSIVEVTLEPRGSGTRLRLTHRDLPTEEVENHSTGWTEMLDRLARAVLASRPRAAAHNPANPTTEET